MQASGIILARKPSLRFIDVFKDWMKANTSIGGAAAANDGTERMSDWHRIRWKQGAVTDRHFC